jgi:hypothetical protein
MPTLVLCAEAAIRGEHPPDSPQDKPASPDMAVSPWVVDRSLNVAPQAAPVAALKYRLLPPSWELKEGNAAPIYLRLVHQQSDAARKNWTEMPKPWNLLPVDKVPLAEAHKFLQDGRFAYFLRQIELGARRRTAEWNYTVEEPNPIGLLLPDAQNMRNIGPILVLRVRLALAEGDFKAALHHLETGFAFSRHVAEGPTLIHSLVAMALASQFANAVADMIERPDAPNLYWALSALPRPLIDLRKGMDFEYQTLEKQFPELGDLDRERSAEQWDDVLRRFRKELQVLILVPAEEGRRKLPDYVPKNCAPGDPAAKSPDLPEARRYVSRAKRLSAEKVEAMPPAQLLLLYIVGMSDEIRDDWFRASYLPYPQARPLLNTAIKRLREAPIAEGYIPSRALLPGLDRVMSAEVRLERNLAALQTIEALRMHAAAHEGKLPDKLSDVSVAPIPSDPGTGRPFEYSREGDTATLVSRIPGEPVANSGVRYRVSIRKK